MPETGPVEPRARVAAGNDAPTLTAGARAPGVTVVVLNWNGREDTLRCLVALSALTYPNVRTLVVDNGSQDGSVDAIRARFPGIELIETGRNLGYAGGNNVGIRAVLERPSERYLLLLNNDTVVDPDLVGAFVDAAEAHPDAAVLGAKIYFQDRPDILWFAGGRWESRTSNLVHDGQGEQDSGQYDELRDVDYVTGCAFFMRADAVRRIGLLDDRFFLTFEEADWCYRARAAGARCLYVPTARLWHKVSASLGGMSSALGSYYYSRNRLLWGERHLGFVRHAGLLLEAASEVLFPALVLNRRTSASLGKHVYWSLRGRGFDRSDYGDPYYRGRVLGIRDYLLRRFGECPTDIRRRLATATATG